MRTLYPAIEPFNSGHLKADSIHEIYFEQSGNATGIPVLFIHGGPGAGSNENHRRYFDPAVYRIINFDQRGCNRSAPQGETRNNTTADLLSDIERLREQLSVDKWVIFAGSWGATLGLLYAETCPHRVSGMILRGVFLARKRDLDWFVSGVNRLFPDAWTAFREFIPADKQHDLVGAYYDCLHGSDVALALTAARRWSEWSGKIVTWLMDIGDYTVTGDRLQVLNEARIELHYAKHAYFIRENQILADIDKIPQVPIRLVHGRRDLTCTLDASWALHQALPQSTLNIVREGGHLASEPVMTDALILATDSLARDLR